MYSTTLEQNGEILWLGKFATQPTLHDVTEALRVDARKTQDYVRVLATAPRVDFRCDNNELASDCRDYAVKLLDLAIELMMKPDSFQIISRVANA